MGISASFQLPVTKDAADNLVSSYLSTITPYLSYDEQGKSQLLNDLEALKNKAIAIATSMLAKMGYEGDLSQMEQELNKKIKLLQGGTNFLNGEALGEFFIWELAKAAPYSFKLQEAYKKFLEKQFGIATEEELKKANIEELATQIFQLAGVSTQYTLRVSQDGTSIRGIGGKLGGGTSKFTKSFFFKDLTPGMQKTLKKAFEKTGLMQVGMNQTDDEVSYDFQIDEKTIYNFLKLKTTPYKGQDLSSITDLIEKDSELVNKVKAVLEKKLLDEYKGEYREIFQETVSYVLGKANPKDLFAGQNAAKKLTGLFGEIQGLYYIRVICPNAPSEWVATEGSEQPHADLILELAGERFGIQVKNTQKSEAVHEVTFENFKANVLGGSDGGLNLNFLKEEGIKMLEGLNLSQYSGNIFNAAGGLISMESFNIECRKLGKKYRAGRNKEFSDTRKRIVDAAQQAQKAMLAYAAGMMFMQLRPLGKGETSSNTLYLIGGTLAITGASILIDIINNLESKLPSFKLTFSNQKSTGTPETIVEFYNNHEKTSQYVLQSSYTFNLGG